MRSDLPEDQQRLIDQAVARAPELSQYQQARLRELFVDDGDDAA